MSSPDIHPDLRLAARAFPRQVGLPRTLSILRASIYLTDLLPRLGVRRIAVNDNVTVRAHVPKNLEEPSAALLWIHGGGYVMGTARQDDFFCRKVMHETGIPVVSVDYRLAPEHPYPIPLEDCYAALLAVRAGAGSIRRASPSAAPVPVADWPRRLRSWPATVAR